MTRSSKILNIAGLLAVVATTALFAVNPSEGSANAAATDSIGQRIDAAFSMVSDPQAEPALLAAASRVQKGDLLVRAKCATQSWPDIASDCLLTANGATVAPVRTVTIGHQVGEATTVLVRMPAPQVASR